MRVAQVAPLFESVPPRLYGGTERIVHYLTEQLIELGHDVTLFASRDSKTSARLCGQCERALRLDPQQCDPVAQHLCEIEEVAQRRNEFDIIHFHVDYLHFPISRRDRLRHLTTLHGRLDIPTLEPLYREYSEMPVVSISRSQQIPLPHANWIGTVHHGLPLNLLQYSDVPEDYLAFVGRVSPEKGLARAIHIAKAVGTRLRVAAKVDTADAVYFEKHIVPLLSDPAIEFVGEIAESEKSEFMGKAKALLFPVDWPEPFGLVMIEAMACGTPVIAFRCGSVPEIIEHGLTGFIVDDVEGAISATRRIGTLDRRAVRRGFERRFTVNHMALQYLKLYTKIARGGPAPELSKSRSAA